MRPTPAAAFEIIKQFEGFRSQAYLCPANVWTAGWGHVGPEVREGLTVTRRSAEMWLEQDLRIAAKRLEARIGADVIRDLTDGQYAALLSFVFNLGANSSWTVWKVLKARDFDAVPAQLLRFVNGGGKRLPGLVRRRAAEVALWSEGDHEAPSSAETRNTPTPPTHEEKPIAQSKTFWTGAGLVATGLVQGAQNIQALAAPQAAHSDLIAKLVGLSAVLIVAGGVAVMVFRYLDGMKRRA